MYWDKVVQQIFASKINSIKVTLWRLLLVSLALVTTQNAMAFSGTLNFSGSDAALGTTVNDGEASSTDIGGVVIEIYSASTGNTNNGHIWAYYSDVYLDGATITSDEGITDDSGFGAPTLIIRSQGGTDFSFSGIRILDYLQVYIAGSGRTLRFEGFQGGASTGAVNLNTATGTTPTSFNQGNGLTASIFQNVDEVRITASDATDVTLAMDDIAFANAVVPDSTPPTVTSVSVPSNATYIAGQSLSFTVNTSENVIVNTGGGTPRIALTIGATTKYATYSSGTGTSALLFSYTVESGLVDSDGITVGALGLNSGTMKDAANNDMTLTLNSVGSTASVLVDSTAPTVSSVTASTANGTYKLGDSISIQVNFSEVVTVNTGGGTPQLTLETGTTDRTANYTGGTGTSSLTFSYTVQSGDNSNDLDYVATNSLSLNGGTIRDAASNNATLTLASPGAANSLGNSKALIVDGVVPSVTSTAPVGGAVSTDVSVDFTVNFSESVSNISTDDFALGTTGGATGTIASVSASSGSSVTVTVSAIAGNGTIKLNLNASTNISDAAGNSGPAAYSSGTTHTVAIPTAPGAPTIGTATAGDGQADVTFTAPGSNGGSAITQYTATASPGGATGNCAGPAACTITVGSLTNGTAYTFTVTATNGIGTGSASGASNSVTPKANQTITFAQPSNYNFGATPTLSATSSAALTVSFSSSTTGVCTITSGGALTLVAAGTCTIDADQAGNASTNAATTVTRSFTVNAIVPDAPTIGTATAGNTQATVTFTAPASTGGAAILAGGYTVTSSPGNLTATGSSSPITVTGLSNGVSYTFTVTAANSAGTGAASAASNSITPASPQTITFANPGAQNFGTSPTLSATSTSGLTVSFTSSTTSVCTVSGTTLTFLAAGTCTINADQAGDSTFLPASQVSRSFAVNAVVPGAPTIGTAIAGDTQASVAFVAPVNIGGSAITSYTVTVNPAHVAPVNGASSPIVVTGLTNGVAYTFTVKANNVAGAGTASGTSNSITPAATQTITFANPGAQNFGTTPTLTATTDATGLTPTFTSSTTGVCTITTGGALTFVAAGTCTINADQAGNASYLAATQVSRSFAVNAVVPGAPTIGTATAGNTQATVAFTAPASNGGSVISSYTVTANPGGATASGAGSPITFSGLTNATSYTFTVKATNGAGTGVPSASSNAVTPKASQTINFTNPGEQIVGATVTLSATASSGSAPSFSSATPAVCTLAGNQATMVAVGTCTINADESGSAAYESASTSQSFVVKPEPNKVPVITQGGSSSITVAEDGKAVFNLSATDANNDVLSWSIQTPPQHGTAEVGITGGTSYTPAANYSGSDSFVVAVSDGKDTATNTVSVTVTPVNDAPTITGSPAVSVDQDATYSFVPAATDVDTGSVLTFSITNKPTWASFNAATGALTGTPANTDAGKVTGIVISVSDGTATTALPAFDIEVIATIDPLQPVVTAPADLELNATAMFTPVDIRQALGISAAASATEVDQALKGLASDGVSGKSCCTTSAEGLSATTALSLAPGRHEIKWKATNAVGVSGEAVQVLNIKPLVSLSQSQIAVRGSDVTFSIHLNGDSPTYPLDVPYVIDSSSSATGAEHNLTSGVASFKEKGQLEIAIPVSLKEVTGFSDSKLVVALGSGINAGATSRHTIDIRNGNVPPAVSISISQGGVSTSLVTPNGGPVSVSVTVNDPNKLDTHTFDWSATSGLADTDGNPVNASRTFSPAGLVGSHQVLVTVTDSAGASVQSTAYFRVVSTLPLLNPNTDTDQDGINDELEGTGDTDDNGIPDYQDNMPSSNILPQQSNTTNAYLIECDPGVRCGLGLFARGGSSGGVQILDQEIGTLNDLVIDPTFDPVGGIFDFAIRDLPTPGQSVRVVIPQRSAIPANAVYRKYQRGRWVTFISDADNAVHSTAGNPGYCPPPGSADWIPGLTAGHMCVQLTIEDGGPNDDDGLVNSAVVDPGAVSTASPVVPPVEPPVIEVKAKRGGAMSEVWLLALAGLLLLSRTNSKRLMIALLALVAVNTQAAAESDIYARVDIYQAKGDQAQGDFNAALTNAGHKFTLSGYDVSRMAYQVAVGYGWNDFTYTEIGYLDLGDTKVNLLLNGNEDLDSFGASLAKHYPRTASGVTLSQAFIYTLTSNWRLVGEIGLFVWQDETNLNVTGINLSGDDGVDPILGASVDYKITDAVRLGANIRQVMFGDQNVSLLGVSARWAF